MNDVEEFSKLVDLYVCGVFSDEEFVKVKVWLLGGQVVFGMGIVVGFNIGVVNGLCCLCLDCWIGGVCGGIVCVMGLDLWVWCLIFIVFFLVFGSGIFFYVLFWIFVFEE